MSIKMKAVVRDTYGPPEVLQIRELPKPRPADDEILIRVHAAAVNKGDTELLLGSPLWVRLVGFGVLKPKQPTLGTNFAGRVEAVGTKVRRLAAGDDVFGDLLMHGVAGFAEYVCVSESAPVVEKPPNVSYEEAASLPEAGLIALQGLRDKGQLRAGQHVLINGAGGGAGSFAVQLAKSMGATVTGVDDGGKQDWMRSLGADYVIDYTRHDLGATSTRYDVILDVIGARSILEWRSMLVPGGVYAAVGGTVSYIAQAVLWGGALSVFGDRKLGMLAVRPNTEDLTTIADLVASGQVRATVDRAFAMSDASSALRYVLEGRAKGRAVLSL